MTLQTAAGALRLLPLEQRRDPGFSRDLGPVRHQTVQAAPARHALAHGKQHDGDLRRFTALFSPTFEGEAHRIRVRHVALQRIEDRELQIGGAGDAGERRVSARPTPDVAVSSICAPCRSCVVIAGELGGNRDRQLREAPTGSDSVGTGSTLRAMPKARAAAARYTTTSTAELEMEPWSAFTTHHA